MRQSPRVAPSPGLSLRVAAAISLLAGAAFAQDAQPVDDALQDALDAPVVETQAEPEADVEAAPDAEQAPDDLSGDINGEGNLQALVIDVDGRNARWRPSPDAEWRPVQVNDLMDAGAEVDVGFRTSVAMRVGRNATILIDRMTTVRLPRIVEDGEILRTTAALQRGRIDVKVDHVGLENDFAVITPASTLAVKGTEFAASYGPAFGVEVQGARTNRINAIELRFFRQNRAVSLSGGAVSNSRFPSPVVAALASTVSAPPAATTGEGVSDTAITQSPAPNDTVRDTVNIAVQNFTLQNILSTAITLSGAGPVPMSGGGSVPNPGSSAGPGSPMPGSGAGPGGGGNH